MTQPLPRAFISHSSPGRIRLRVPEMQHQDSFFNNVRDRLGALGAVRQLSTNSRTASVLIEYSGDLGDLGELGTRNDLFSLEDAPKPASLHQWLYRVTRHPDAVLKSATGGRVDMSALGILTLTGLGIRQIATGYALPAGWTLLWNAVNLVREAADKSEPESK
jgi:hypothetical protein